MDINVNYYRQRFGGFYFQSLSSAALISLFSQIWGNLLCRMSSNAYNASFIPRSYLCEQKLHLPLFTCLIVSSLTLWGLFSYTVHNFTLAGGLQVTSLLQWEEIQRKNQFPKLKLTLLQQCWFCKVLEVKVCL